MLHARKDYDAIQPAPDGPISIPDDEPVMLFRGQDEYAPAVLALYAELLDGAGNADMAAVVRKHRKRMLDWQREHKSKRPDMPADVGR